MTPPQTVRRVFLRQGPGEWLWAPDEHTSYMLQVQDLEDAVCVEAKAVALDYLDGRDLDRLAACLYAHVTEWPMCEQPRYLTQKLLRVAKHMALCTLEVPTATLSVTHLRVTQRVNPVRKALVSAADEVIEQHWPGSEGEAGRYWLGDSMNAAGDPWWAHLRGVSGAEWRGQGAEGIQRLRAPEPHWRARLDQAYRAAFARSEAESDG